MSDLDKQLAASRAAAQQAAEAFWALAGATGADGTAAPRARAQRPAARQRPQLASSSSSGSSSATSSSPSPGPKRRRHVPLAVASAVPGEVAKDEGATHAKAPGEEAGPRGSASHKDEGAAAPEENAAAAPGEAPEASADQEEAGGLGSDSPKGEGAAAPEEDVVADEGPEQADDAEWWGTALWQDEDPEDEVVRRFWQEERAARRAMARRAMADSMRDPLGPAEGGPRTWRGQAFREGSQRWANRGGANREYFAWKYGGGRGGKKGGKGGGKGGGEAEFFEHRVPKFALLRAAEHNTSPKGAPSSHARQAGPALRRMVHHLRRAASRTSASPQRAQPSWARQARRQIVFACRPQARTTGPVLCFGIAPVRRECCLL